MGQAHAQGSPNSMVFSPQEINKLYKRFKKLDLQNTGELRPEDFQDIPALAQNPLISRIIAIFDKNKTGRISFVEFIKGLEVLSVGASEEEKLRFMFKIYDVDEDGFISPTDLSKVLRLMVGLNLTEQQLAQLVDRTIQKGDEDRDGRISYIEFCKMVKNLDIVKKLTLTYE